MQGQSLLRATRLSGPLLSGLLAALLLLGAPARAAALRIATGELPPYATQTRPDLGIALHIVRRAFELVGYQVEYQFLPWTRAKQETRQGLFDASAYWGASADRRRDFLLSDNVLTEQWLLVHRRSMALNWATLDDLRGYKVGYVRDYTYTPEFWSKIRSGEFDSDATPTDLAGLRKLLMGRIDVLPMERNVACDLLSHHFKPSEVAQIAAHPRLLTESFTTHLILPPQVPRSAELLRDFNLGLKKLKESGEHARLMKSLSSCPAGWGEAPASPMTAAGAR